MPDLNDNELDALFSTVSQPEPSADLSQRIMAAISAAPAEKGVRGFLAALFGTNSIALPAGGALASLLFGLAIGLVALPETTQDTLSTEDQYLAAVAGDNWDTSFEDILQ